MKTYYITYRSEFEVEVEAENESKALEKAKMSESWSLIGDWHSEFVIVEEDIIKDADRFSDPDNDLPF